MKPIDIILIVALAVLAVGVGIYLIVKKKKGGTTGCDCGCSGCPHAGACGTAKKSSQKPKENENKS